jgi:hypothetical protein
VAEEARARGVQAHLAQSLVVRVGLKNPPGDLQAREQTARTTSPYRRKSRRLQEIV